MTFIRVLFSTTVLFCALLILGAAYLMSSPPVVLPTIQEITRQ